MIKKGDKANVKSFKSEYNPVRVVRVHKNGTSTVTTREGMTKVFTNDLVVCNAYQMLQGVK
jgi:hypothetical protein